MAKKYNTLVNKANRSTNKQEALMARGRRGAYRGLQGVLEDVFGNLASTTKGQRGKLTRANSRDLALIARIGQRQRAADSRSTHAYTRAVEAMGSGPGNMSSNELGVIGKPLTVAANVARAATKSGTAYGKSTAKVGQGVMNILESNAKGIQAAADQGAAIALSEQATADATVIATQRHEIALAEMQQQMELERMKTQSKLERKQAIFSQRLVEGTAGPVGMQLTAASNMLTNAASTIQNLKLEFPDAAPNELAERASLSLALTSQEDKGAVQRLADLLTRDTQSGVGATEVAGDVADILRSYPEWQELGKGKKRDDLLDSIYRTYRANEMSEGRNPGADVLSSPKQYETLVKQDSAEAEAQGKNYDEGNSAVKFMELSINAAIRSAAPDMTSADRADLVQLVIGGEEGDLARLELSDTLKAKLSGLIKSWPKSVRDFYSYMTNYPNV